MTFPALPYEVDEHLVAGMRSIYDAAERLRLVPLDKLDTNGQETIREALARTDAIKDLLYVLRMGKPRTDDVAPVDLLGGTNMFKRVRPVTKRAYELLADGEWHDYETVVREAAKEVLPGEAHRYMETSRVLRGGGEDRVKNNDAVILVERGQRAVAVNVISGNERIEMDPPRAVRTNKRKIRLRPPDLWGPRRRPNRRSGDSQVPELAAEPVPDAAADAPGGADVST